MNLSTAPARRRHRHHANPFTIRGSMTMPDWPTLFGGRAAPFALDVGFGEGGFLLELGRRHPEWNVLGLEIRPHLVEGLRAQAAAQGLNNVYPLLANANAHLNELLPGDSVAFVAINFPDPWFKKRHHKRRVVNAAWLPLLAEKLQHGAQIHAMSDYAPIARQMQTLLEAAPGFRNLDGPGNMASQSTTGIVTEREITHTARGDAVYRLRFLFERHAAVR